MKINIAPTGIAMQYDFRIEMTIKERYAVWKANTRTGVRRQQWVGYIPWGYYPSHCTGAQSIAMTHFEIF